MEPFESRTLGTISTPRNVDHIGNNTFGLSLHNSVRNSMTTEALEHGSKLAGQVVVPPSAGAPNTGILSRGNNMNYLHVALGAIILYLLVRP